MPQPTATHSRPRLKAAIVGFGISGELSHAYGMRGNDAYEIVAVCDLSPSQRDKAAQLLGCRVFADHRTMLSEIPDLDLAAIITRSDTHCALACDFLEAGVNVLITKPWVTSASEAESVLMAQKKSGKKVFPWIPMYWSPEYEIVNKLINENAIGDVFMIRRHITQFLRREDWQTQSKYGGGCLLNWGAHIIHPILGLAGAPPKSVSGSLQQAIDPGDAEDNFCATFQFHNGVRAIAEYTQASEGLPSFMIQGTGGMITSDGEEVTLIQKDPATSQAPLRKTYPVHGKRFGEEIDIYRDVAASLLTGKPFRATTEDAFTGSIVIDAIKQSHQSGKTVPIPSSRQAPAPSC